MIRAENKKIKVTQKKLDDYKPIIYKNMPRQFDCLISEYKKDTIRIISINMILHGN
jgi:hypothetical protein